MDRSEKFANPPIVELVLGVQFSPLTKLTAGHFGLFWKGLGDDWNEPSDGPIIEDQFEWFDRPKRSAAKELQLRFEPMRFPGRFLVAHKQQDRLIQMQATRFHLNWRKRPGGVYLSYGSLIAEFEETFAKFAAFVEKAHLGSVVVNQWELTYIDAFPEGEYWQTPADWAKVLPGFFSDLFSTNEIGTKLEHRAAEWSYEIEPKRGRLHVVAQAGRAGDDTREALLLQMTARGPGTNETVRAGFDLGHKAALRTFLKVVSEETLRKWRLA